MKSTTYTLEFLTPCFCAGANQATAEVRPSAIRGQLRWWFRALGGSKTDETSVFGGAAGSSSASALLVRVRSIRSNAWTPPDHLDLASDSYVYHFAKVSGTEGKGAAGPRWNRSGGAIAPKSAFHLDVVLKRRLPSDLQVQFDKALSCFLQLGGIGLRLTRGLGTFICHEQPFTKEILDLIQQHGFRVEHRLTALPSEDIAREIGSLTKGSRKENQMKHDRPSPFGASSPRQTSAIYFRPVRSAPADDYCTLVVFEAPHQRVLDRPAADRGTVVGHTPSRLHKPKVDARPRRW